jgi:N-methylhydantoinase A
VTQRTLRLGLDIGGTFTDVLVVDGNTREFWVGKTLTTPEDPSVGAETALLQVLEAAGADASQLNSVVHGTTLVTNAIIERKGDRTALVTTKGFRDAVEIAREHRYDMYDLNLDLPLPIAPRHLRFELDERILADGTEYRPIDAREVSALADRLRQHQVAAVAVCFIHSYRSPDHEVQAGRLLAEKLHGIRISLSNEVAGEIREYERTSTTLANVYVQRLVETYMERLEQTLTTRHFGGHLLIMLSSGGVSTVQTAQKFPVRMVESGPAGGALAAAHFGRLIGRPDLLSFDMGGTTAKACIIESGRPTIATEFEVDRVYRFKRGSGLPIKASTVDLIEIGAGGGSIARVDKMGLIKVGPNSAGANPGPVAYGLGGTEPTVTDADLVLGYLDAEFFLGGRMKLDVDSARLAIAERIARPLGLSEVEAAWAIHGLVNENMASAARIHAAERGKDIRQFPMFAFGGAGPVHAYGVARILRLQELICPLGAGVGSTVGFLAAPLAFDFVRSHYGLLHRLDWDQANRLLETMETEGRELLARSSVAESQFRVERTADMRLKGQWHQINVPLPDGRLGPETQTSLEAAFEGTYTELYKRTPPGVPVETINWRVLVSGPRPDLSFNYASASRAPEARKGVREIYLAEAGGFHNTPVYDRYALKPGDYVPTPCVIEERESTVVIGPDATVGVDEHCNLRVQLKSQK